MHHTQTTRCSSALQQGFVKLMARYAFHARLCQVASVAVCRRSRTLNPLWLFPPHPGGTTTDYVGVFQWLMVIEPWKCSTGSYPTRPMGCLDNYGYRESIPELATHIFNSRTPLSTSQNVNPSEKPNEFIFSFFDQSLSRRAWRVSPSHVIKCMIFQSTSNGNKLYRIKSGRVPWPFDKQMVPPLGTDKNR